MAINGNPKNSALVPENAQAVLEKARMERAKTEADLDEACARLDQAQGDLSALMNNLDITGRQAAAANAAEKVKRLEAELAALSSGFKSVQEAHESAVVAESSARTAYGIAHHSHVAPDFTKLEKKLARAQEEFDAVRKVARFVDGDAKHAENALARAEAELADAQNAHDIAVVRLDSARREVNAVAAQYLESKTDVTEQLYDNALVMRDDAEVVVEVSERRLKEADKRLKDAQKTMRSLKDAEEVKEKYEKKKQALTEAKNALNRAKSAKQASEKRRQSSEVNLEKKTAELEAASSAVEAHSAAISEKMDALKLTRKDLFKADRARESAEEQCALAKKAVSEAQGSVDSLQTRLAKLDEIIVKAKLLIAG